MAFGCRIAPLNTPRLLAAVLLCTFPVVLSASPGSLVHKPAPRFIRTDLQGRRFELSASKGRVVLLTFWATWCAPCQVEMPRLIDWQDRLGSQGLQVVGISMDDDDAPVRDIAARRNINFPVLMGDARLARLYGGILGLPVTFLIDRHGRIAACFKGEPDLNAMEQAVRRLLGHR